VNNWTKRDILDLWRPVYPDLLALSVVYLLTLSGGSLIGAVLYALLYLIFIRAVLSFLLWMTS
jgi:hypothetical protein